MIRKVTVLGVSIRNASFWGIDGKIRNRDCLKKDSDNSNGATTSFCLNIEMQ